MPLVSVQHSLHWSVQVLVYLLDLLHSIQNVRDIQVVDYFLVASFEHQEGVISDSIFLTSHFVVLFQEIEAQEVLEKSFGVDVEPLELKNVFHDQRHPIRLQEGVILLLLFA